VVAILGFAAAVPVVLGVDAGRRLFWAAAIASLPLLWVLGGYHLWRRICPLAVIAQLGRLLGRGGTRRLSGAVAGRYMLLQLAIMIAALSLRLIMTNGTRWALVGFLVAVAILAAVSGLIWTGKTWCNLLCPVGLVERIYTEPARLAGPTHSQCKPCTACKKNCPDIDLEQSYWKELEQPSRRLAYFAWPGVVLAFYVYYYLVAGTWDDYFSGAWTLEDAQIARWAAPGWTFFEAVPVAVAAPLTLIGGAAISVAVFVAGEGVARRLAAARGGDEAGDRERIRHRALAVAGFSAFVLFYFFGGQPTIRLLPGWFGALFSTAVVIAASAIFFRRWRRRQADFVKEKFAEKILKKWEWGEAPPSDNLQDIYLVHSERVREREARLAAYKETIRDMVADGLVTRSELGLLDSLRAQLGVTDRDHRRLLGELSEEERQLFDPDYQGSAEQRLQAAQYQRELTRVTLSAARAGRPPALEILAGLREEHQVSEEDAEAALASLRAPEGPIAALLGEQIAAVRELAAARRAASAETVAGQGSASGDFLRFACERRACERSAAALRILASLDSIDLGDIDLIGGGEADRELAAERLRERSPGGLTESLIAACGEMTAAEPEPAAPIAAPLLAIAADSSIHLRAAAIQLLTRFDDAEARAAVAEATVDPEPLVRETAFNGLRVCGRLTRVLMGRAQGDPDARVREAARIAASPDIVATAESTGELATLDGSRRIESLTGLEKMMLLRQVPLFQTLEPADLEDLTFIARERRFAAGEDLCRQGEAGDEVLVIVSGEVEVWTESEAGSRRVVGRSGAGECVGEMGALDAAPRSAHVTAAEPTRALALDGADFRALLLTRAAIGRRIIEDLVGRLRRMIAATSVS
jgi:hypothetical protein